jgi:hypothetical protein
MEVLGRIVSHNKFGEGKIVAQGETSISIEFSTGVKIFQYPDCFEKFITFVNGEIPFVILEDIKEMEKEERVKRIEESISSSGKRLIGKRSKDSEANLSSNLISIHKACWEYLLKHQQENPGFHFVPRKMNNKNRLNEGYYFTGGNDHLLITFWDGVGDTKNVTHTIDFGVLDDGCAYIQFSSRDDDDRAKYLKEMISILEKKLGNKYNCDAVNYWRRFYPANLDFIDALQSFIENEKPIIDEYVKEHPDLALKLADSSNDKYITKILDLQ